MKKRTIYLSLALVLTILVGCKYDFILPTPVAPISGAVNFSTQVAPIFSTGGKCTSCHKAGGQAPDLTATGAYASIVPSLINTGTPNQSKIYAFPSPATSTHSWKKYSASEAAILLQWITEGAKNN